MITSGLRLLFLRLFLLAHLPLLIIYFSKGIKPVEKYIFNEMEKYGYINKNKHDGKQTQYKLGTCFKFDQFIFVAFSKFDSQYQAYLDLPDYLFCLANFWTELNRVYNGENIVVPLMGSGLTRLANNSLSKQQQLQLLIDSLKYSNLSFAYDSHITIVLSKELKDKIKLFNIE